MVSRPVAHVSVVKASQGGGEGQGMQACTYRTHDCGLPVKLWPCQSSCRLRWWAVRCAALEGARESEQFRRLSRRASGCDVPDHLRWGRQSRTREGHYSDSQLKVLEAAWQDGCRGTEIPSPPRTAGSHASKQAGSVAGGAGRAARTGPGQ
jgi:hypothetical protein